jgi:hypothetical protein
LVTPSAALICAKSARRDVTGPQVDDLTGILFATVRSYLPASTPTRLERTASIMIAIYVIAAAVVLCACFLIVRARRAR